MVESFITYLSVYLFSLTGGLPILYGWYLVGTMFIVMFSYIFIAYFAAMIFAKNQKLKYILSCLIAAFVFVMTSAVAIQQINLLTECKYVIIEIIFTDTNRTDLSQEKVCRQKKNYYDNFPDWVYESS